MKTEKKHGLLSEEQRAIREARLQKAAMFLDNVLVPAIQQGKKITRAELDKIVDQYKEDNRGPGADFETSHVWGVAYERALINKCLASKKIRGAPSNAAAVVQALDLLTRLG